MAEKIKDYIAVSLRLNKELHARLKAEADKQHRTLHNMVTCIIMEYLDNH